MSLSRGIWNVLQSWDFPAGIFFFPIDVLNKANHSMYKNCFCSLWLGKELEKCKGKHGPATELHSSLQNFRPRSLKGAQPSHLSLNFWAIKEEEWQEHLNLPQVSTERGQTTPFTDFYYNLDITTADYSSNLVVTTTTPTFCCILYLQTELSQRPGKRGGSGAATWTSSFRSRAGKIKINLTQTTTHRNTLHIYEESVQLLSHV